MQINYEGDLILAHLKKIIRHAEGVNMHKEVIIKTMNNYLDEIGYALKVTDYHHNDESLSISMENK